MGLGSSSEKVSPAQRTDVGFRLIPDQYRTFAELSTAMRKLGFENCEIICALDFTGSNREQGAKTFGGKDLHYPHELLLSAQQSKSKLYPAIPAASAGGVAVAAAAVAPSAGLVAPMASAPIACAPGGPSAETGEGEGEKNDPKNPGDVCKIPGEVGKTSAGGVCDPSSFNIYQSVISAMGTAVETLSPAKRIHVVGFGDMYTEDHSIFCLKRRAEGEQAVISDLTRDCQPCYGVEQVLETYLAALPHTTKSGPTSFVPVIESVIQRVQQTRKYTFLFIIGDGAVTDKATNVAAVVKASNYPISISFIGIGDGPWDIMREFDDELPQRRFDNWQTVIFHTEMKECGNNPLRFAVRALQETPDQLRAMRALKYIS